jgi:WD40 repeat protein
LRADAKGEVRLWRAGNGEPIATLEHDHEVYALAFSPDGKVLLTVSARLSPGKARRDGGLIQLWDSRTGKSIGRAWRAQEELERLSFRPDGKEILAIQTDRAVTWDVATGKQRHVFAHPHSGRVKVAAWSPDGKHVLTAGGAGGRNVGLGLLHIWDAETGQPACAPVLHPHDVESLALSPDGRTAVTGCLGNVRLWKLEDTSKTK